MKRAPLLAVLVLAAAVLPGCYATKFTGGGQITSGSNFSAGKASARSAGGSANYGFTYDAVKGNLAGTYRDGDVAMSLTGNPTFDYYSDGDENCMSADGNYRSTNPRQRGDGTLHIYACDNGEGRGSYDYLEVQVNSGPFEGYSNSGYTRGNLQAHKSTGL
ncbi:MAG: hypothetical protein QOE08_846 [Thermoleophilaceae bacterium]|nr:hypothetical protein [Thermoleophilaceae bacterium]